MTSVKKSIIRVQALVFAILFAVFAFAGCKNSPDKPDENGFTDAQVTMLCDAARAFYLLEADYNSKDSAISFRQLEEFAFYVYAYGNSLETTAADSSGYLSVDGGTVDEFVKTLFGVKLGTRSSRPSTKLNFYYRDGKYHFMIGKELNIAANIVGVETTDEGDRLVTVRLSENGSDLGKIELTVAAADSENNMRINASKAYRSK